MASGIDLAAVLGMPLWLLIVVMIWSLAWKGIALWKAAGKKHLIWFVLILVVNTIGILEILYIFLFSKLNLSGKEEKRVRKRR